MRTNDKKFIGIYNSLNNAFTEALKFDIDEKLFNNYDNLICHFYIKETEINKANQKMSKLKYFINNDAIFDNNDNFVFGNYTDENKNMQFDCKNIQDESIDFAFSFGVFCHLSASACESYLKDVFRVLKKGGTAIFMYSDDKGLQDFYKEESFSASRIYGEFNDYSDIMPMIKKYDSECKRILDFRDLLVLITKK
jgi:SAM-dependent methyltransferase